MEKPRGVANNNPGNLIKAAADKWQGVSEAQADPKFWQFDTAVMGIRALARQLIIYQDRHGCKTIEDHIKRYAPSVENDTRAYELDIAQHMEIAPDDEIDMHKYEDLRGMVEGVIFHENGAPWKTWYTEAQIVKALLMAGVEAPRRSLMVNPQVIGSTIAATAAAAAPVLQQTKDSLQPLAAGNANISHWVFGTIIAGAVCAIIAKVNERNKGIS